jgi:hypothetical protein
MKKRPLLLLVLIVIITLTLFAFPSVAYADTSGAWTYTVSGGNATITGYNVAVGGVTVVVIPSTLGGNPVTIIGTTAFPGCTSLTSITIPTGVTSIGMRAFQGCTALTSVTILNSGTSIGSNAFMGEESTLTIYGYTDSTAQSHATFYSINFVPLEPVNSIIVTGAGGATTVVNGSTLQMSAEVLPAGATNKTVTWSVVAGTGTATIDAGTGVLTGTGVGTVTVTATANDSSDVTGTLGITVTAASTAPAPAAPAAPKPLTLEEWVLMELNINQLLDHYGATSTGFLNMLYDNSMLRISDETGLNYWNTQLTNNVFGANFIVEHFIFSDEIGSKVAAMTSDEYINFLYQTLFARTPDTEGYNNWLNYMNSGVSKEEILKGFLNSEEWVNICKMFNVTA